jgi:enoyl-CoA hydratase
VAVQAAKRSLRAAIDAGLQDGLACERREFLAVAGSADAREGAEAFLEKRKGSFRHQ